MEIEKLIKHKFDIFNILDKEAEFTSEIYLYNEGGCWAAYEHSAIAICKIYKDLVSLNIHFNEAYELVLSKTEIDLTLATRDCSIISNSDNMLVLSYNKGL